MDKELLVLNQNYRPYIHYDFEIENAVLGAILLEKEAFIRVYSLLDENCFYSNENKFIYQTLRLMFDQNINIDVLTVTHFTLSKESKKWRQTSAFPLPYYLSKLIQNVTSSAHIETHCKILRELHVKRLMLEAKMNTDDSVESALFYKRKIEEAFNIGKQDNWMSLEEVITTHLINRMDAVKTGKQVSFKTGFATLDYHCAIDAGDFVIIGARPSMGKTAIAMQMAANIAAAGNVVGIISLETISERLGARLISAQSTLEYWKIWKNKLNEEEEQEFYQQTDKLIALPLYINDKPAFSAMDIRIQTNKLRKQHKDKKMVIIIDYLQLIIPEKSRQTQRYQEIGEISRALRLLALELENTAIIALCQLNREAEGDKKPKMSQLRESGSIEQDADKIWLLHRDRNREDELKKNGVYDDYDAELIIAKSKEGWTGEIPLLFSPERMIFKEKKQEIEKVN